MKTTFAGISGIIKKGTFFALILVAFHFIGCTKAYRPVSDWEQKTFSQAVFDVYPDDVRADICQYENTMVAWVGVIQESEFYENKDNYEVALLVDHRYFNWKGDVTQSHLMYYPSIRGEGLFQVNWHLKKDADLDYFQEKFAVGNLAVAYGIPDSLADNVILLDCKYLRVIDRDHFRADLLDYIPKDRQAHWVKPTGNN